MRLSLARPLSPARLALISVGSGLAVAVYCLVYTNLAGQPSTVRQALTWSLVNILPWVPAIEWARHARTLPRALIVLGGGLCVSLALGLAAAWPAAQVDFEFWRRLPAFLILAALVTGLRRWTRPQVPASSAELPLLPRQIDWVRAAGNYVELRGRGPTVVHRTPLADLERELSDHGFVRIHRSLLVRRASIARIRPDDVVLADGTHLKVGKRYRAALAA